MYSIYPNIYLSLRIVLTLPVTVAAGERSFSKLKLVKNYLRSCIHQERLNDLAIISLEDDIAKHLDSDELVKDFANLKSRKVYF